MNEPTNISKESINVVWLKKDIRTHDHGSLSSALLKNHDFIILYMYEPDQLSHPTVHGSHVNFANEGLIDLEHRLTQIMKNHESNENEKQCITIAMGEATNILSRIHTIRPIHQLLAHQETGHWVSFQRDKRVRKWCKSNHVQFHEFLQNAVFRCLKHRDDYDKRASHFFGSSMYPSIYNLQKSMRSFLIRGLLPKHPILLAKDIPYILKEYNCDRPSRQHGSETEAMKVLESFLNKRGKYYAKGISSPSTSWDSCTRLSPYLTYGHISIRYVMNEINKQHEKISQNPQYPDRKQWLFSLSSLRSRMHWRSHFIQKLECEPEMEHHALCRAYDKVRTEPNDFNLHYYEAWKKGQTGFPLVDACMRCLLKHGWINFRMRAMLVSFATYNLWLDWRIIDAHLARSFLDFEPGIHFPQIQMQSGTTGINAMRVYNVTKQAKDHDKFGHFIRKYVPELRNVPTLYISEPSQIPMHVRSKIRLIIPTNETNVELEPQMNVYPSPIVDEIATATKSKSIIAEIKRAIKTKEQATKVYIKHGSRRRNMDENMAERRQGASKRKIDQIVDGAQPTIAQMFRPKKKSNHVKVIAKHSIEKKTITTSASVTTKQKNVEKASILSVWNTSLLQTKKDKYIQKAWICQVCTFQNGKPLAPVCEMCDSLR